MRLDKLTTKFQEALGDAQSLALANDHAYIEPAHLLVAMLRQEDGPRVAAAARRRQRAPACRRPPKRPMHKLPQGRRAGAGAGRPRPRRAAAGLPRRKRIKRGDQFIASELFLLALADTKTGHRPHRARATGSRASRSKSAIDAVRGGAAA